MNVINRLWSLHHRQIKGIAGISALFLGLQAFYINASPVNPGNSLAAHQKKFAQGHILVQPKAGLSDDNFDHILNKHGASKKSKIDKINVHLINVPPGQEEKIAAELAQDPNMKFAEVDAQVPLTEIPNDPSLSSQWTVTNINLPAAWDISHGDGIIIAILDSGVEPTHPDLAAKLVPGYNFYDNNTDTSDVFHHGTMVAGVAAAIGNNGVGVAGVAMNSKIMPIRVTDTAGWAYWSTLASGLTYAADHGARVANMSFQAHQSSTVISAAQYLQSKGGVAVNSAGNTGAIDTTPASDALITVAATDSANNRASWSSFGPYVDLSAPGVGVLTTNLGGSYAYVNGTSFSSPTVAGVVALMMAANPKLSPAQITNILIKTSVDLGDPGWDQYYGAGRVDAAAAVLAASQVVISDTQAPTVSLSGLSAGSVVKGITTVNVSASDNIAVSRTELYVGGALVGSDNMPAYSFSWDTTTSPDGNVTLMAKAYDSSGNVATSSVTVSVRNTVDSIAPVVSISSPANGSILKGANVTVQASASDNVGVTSMTLYVDGAVKASSSSGSLSYSLNVKKLSSGAHTIRVDATDASGNVGTQTIQVSK